MELALRHLGPPRRGIEIGASANNPFPGLTAWNLEQPAAGLFRAAQERIVGRSAPVHLVGRGERLPVRSGALDYVLASHVLEHMPDTIRALGEWSRAVRPGGVLFLVVPHRQRTFDRDRPRTELEHHLADYALAMSAEASPMVPTSHYHVWETEDLLRLVEHLVEVGFLDWRLVDVEDVDSKVGNGFTLVAEKRSQPPPLPLPPAGGAVAFHLWTLALPFQVPGRTTEHVGLGPELRAPAGLARGRYRAVPVHGGFPPPVGAPILVDVGEPLPPPVLEGAEVAGSVLRLRGRHLSPTTFLEARHPDGRALHALPVHEAGELSLDLAGLSVPAAELDVVAVNLPPGGGRGPALRVKGLPVG